MTQVLFDAKKTEGFLDILLASQNGTNRGESPNIEATLRKLKNGQKKGTRGVPSKRR